MSRRDQAVKNWRAGVVGLVVTLLSAACSSRLAAADSAAVSVHVSAPATLKDSGAPVLVPVRSALEKCIQNGDAIRSYYVLPQELFDSLEEAARRYAKDHPGAPPHLELPGNILPPSAVLAGTTQASGDFTGTAPAGHYDLKKPVGVRSWAWLSNLNVNAGAFGTELKAEALGSVKVQWTIDYPLHKGPRSGMQRTVSGLSDRLARVPMVGLVRDGRVWAAGRMAEEDEFSIDAVPAGTYTLVVQNVWERFLLVQEKVEVVAGQATAISAKIKRADQCGIGLTSYEAAKNTYPPLNTWFRLTDEKLGVAFQLSSTQRKTESEGGLPAEYTVSEYGALSLTGKYTIYVDHPSYRPITGQPVAATRQGNMTVVALTHPNAKLPDEDYKVTILRMMSVSAIAAPRTATGRGETYALQRAGPTP